MTIQGDEGRATYRDARMEKRKPTLRDAQDDFGFRERQPRGGSEGESAAGSGKPGRSPGHSRPGV